MNIQEMMDKSIEPLKDMENGYYKILVNSNNKDRPRRWRRYIIICCNSCNNVCAKTISTRTNRYDYVDYCNYRCYQNKHMIRELSYDGNLYTINDIPKHFRYQGLNPIQAWIDRNIKNKEYMEEYVKLPCSQLKLKAKRKREWKKIKSDPVLLRENLNKKCNWTKTEAGKVCGKRNRNKPQAKLKAKCYKARYYKDNQMLWRVRSFMRHIHLDSKVIKNKSWKEYGIDIALIKNHLVKQAIPLGGYNKIRTNYHIDHIIPISAYNLDDINEIKKCNNPFNLRWLRAKENMSKGDRIRPQDLEIIKTLPKDIYPQSIINLLKESV